MKAESPLLLTIAVAVKCAKGKQGKNGVKNLSYVVGSFAWNPLRGTGLAGPGSRSNRPTGWGTE